MANAFRSGRYTSTVDAGTATAFGSGKYGDLGATAAAIVLDREARSATLDVDPAAGKLREPLLKVRIRLLPPPLLLLLLLLLSLLMLLVHWRCCCCCRGHSCFLLLSH